MATKVHDNQNRDIGVKGPHNMIKGVEIIAEEQ